MSIPKMTNDLAVIQKLNDLPNAVDGLTAQELKARFDESGLTIQKWINEVLLPGFQAENMAFSGNSSLNAETVQEAIEAVHGQVRDASSGTIVDGAVTREKLAVDLLKRVYGGKPWVSLNTPGSAQNKEADFPIGQIWLRPGFTVVNAAGSSWQAKGCTVAAQENCIRVAGDQTVVTASATQVLTDIGQDGDRVMVLFAIRNKDSEITDLTISLNSGETQEVSESAFEATLVGGALTVEFSATWPSTSLAGGSFDVVNYTVVNLDQVLRQTADAEDLDDWAGYLNGLLPLSSYTSPEAVFIQALNGSWWPIGFAQTPVSRGGTGRNAVGYGELLYGSGGEALERLGTSAENNSFLQLVGGKPAWVGASNAAGNTSIGRIKTGSYTGDSRQRTLTLPVAPVVWFVFGSDDSFVCVGQNTRVKGEYKQTFDGDGTKSYTAYAGLYGTSVKFSTSYTPNFTYDTAHGNKAGVTYNWVAIY